MLQSAIAPLKSAHPRARLHLGPRYSCTGEDAWPPKSVLRIGHGHWNYSVTVVYYVV